MTQEVQPLTWQKRTNLEEHQQFFSKINEIIANLAPTVDEAEAAIAQATQAIASANAAIATANAASASADAASQQAQIAADTVAGYDARMTAVESKNTQQDTAISALQTADGQNVKLSGNQNIRGMKTVPTEATGTRSQQIANSEKVGAELDNYTPMVRTTGNQVIAGVKQFSYNVESLAGIKGGETPGSYTSNYGRFRVTGSDNLPIVGLGFEKGSGVVRLVLNINGNKDPNTQQQPVIQIHFIMNEVDGTLKLQPAYVNKNGTRVFGSEQTLMTWAP